MYTIYANDLPANRKESCPTKYVDDHCDCVGAEEAETLRENLQQESNRTALWMMRNMMCLSTSKTKFLIMGSKRLKNKKEGWEDLTIEMDGEIIKQIKDSKYLGFMMDSNLNQEKHLNGILEKENQEI